MIVKQQKNNAVLDWSVEVAGLDAEMDAVAMPETTTLQTTQGIVDMLSAQQLATMMALAETLETLSVP